MRTGNNIAATVEPMMLQGVHVDCKPKCETSLGRAGAQLLSRQAELQPSLAAYVRVVLIKDSEPRNTFHFVQACWPGRC